MGRKNKNYFLWIKLKAFLKTPFPITRNPWHTSIIASLIVFLLLILFQSIPNASIVFRFFIILGLTFVTGIITFALQTIPPLIFAKFYSEDSWNIGKQILQTIIILLFIGVGNFFYGCIIGGHFSASMLLSYIIGTFLIGIIPAVIITIYMQNSALKQNLQEASILNEQFKQVKVNYDLESNTQIATLTGTTKDSIRLNIDDILYIESIKNYCIVYYVSGNKLKVTKIRTTLSQIEESLLPYSNIIRCHRAFIINIHSIVGVEGNSQGYQLKLKITDNVVPVSRSYTKAFRERHIG